MASGIQEEDMVGTSCGENMGPIREHWLVQHSSKTVGRQNRMLKKPIERIGRWFYHHSLIVYIYGMKLK